MTETKQTNEKALVDTNFLFYLVDKEAGAKHESARKWFSSTIDKKVFVSFQSLREFSNVALKKTSFSANEINRVLEMFSSSFELIFASLEDAKNANLFCETDRKNFWDCLLIATMKRHGIKTILTENTKHFSPAGGIRAKNPLT